ncbi:MAG: VWA domain-containing protein, partial [Hyphomicrobiaceae bacterium]
GAIQELGLQPAGVDLSQTRRISAELVANVRTAIMPVLGIDNVEVKAFASAEYGFTKLEIAMALDNTGSMAGAKLQALKDSAGRLVDTLLDRARQDGDIRISLVPFAQYVNVGTENRYASWIDVRDDYSETLDWCRDEYPVLSKTNCRMVTYTYTNDGTPGTGTYEQCDVTYGAPVYTCTPYTNTYTWNGCVGSRSYPLNIQDGNYGTRVPGMLNTSCPSRIQPLTSSRSELQNAIDGMVATGETYVPSGVMWGWRALSPAQPYGESAGDRTDANGNKISKVLILMTDGENTKSPSYPGHDGTDAALANNLTLEGCAAVKAATIQIFTIAFDVTSNPIKDLLRNCASKPGNFFDARDTGQLDAAMQAIGDQLGGLRLVN